MNHNDQFALDLRDSIHSDYGTTSDFIVLNKEQFRALLQDFHVFIFQTNHGESPVENFMMEVFQ